MYPSHKIKMRGDLIQQVYRNWNNTYLPPYLCCASEWIRASQFSTLLTQQQATNSNIPCGFFQSISYSPASPRAADFCPSRATFNATHLCNMTSLIIINVTRLRTREGGLILFRDTYYSFPFFRQVFADAVSHV